jgi:RND family efflux transporter MFP subunit
MKPWLKWAVAGLIVALLAAGVMRTLAARKTKQAALEAQQLAQKTQVMIELGTVDLVEVKTLDLPATLAISGTIKAVNTAFVKARIPGELQGLTLREGDAVKAGQVLAHIDPLESSARLTQVRQQAQAARAQVAIAQRSFDNNQALVAQGFISGTALETSQANLAAAQSNYAAAQAAVDVAAKSLDDTVLRAPISGLVAQRLAQPGERLAVDTRVLEIVDLSRLELEATLTAADAMQVKPGQTAQLHLDGMTPGMTAKVARINPSATAGSRAVLVYLAIAPNSALRHGLFAQGSLTTGVQTQLAVPLDAVRTDKPEPYLQVIRQNQVQHLSVTPGARSDVNGQTLVAISGAPVGTQALAGSVGILRAGTRVKVNSATPGTR